MTRVHASNGDLVKEYAREYRIFIPIDDIPDDLKNALFQLKIKILQSLWYRSIGYLRAFTKNLSNILSNKRPEGASTITQQVAKNFF